MLVGGSSLFMPQAVYAAAASKDMTAEEAAGDTYGDPNAYAARIQSILERYHKESDAFYNGVNSAGRTGSKPSAAREYSLEVEQPSPYPTYSGITEVPLDLDPGTYDFDWNGTPIASSLYAIGKLSGRNIVINGSVSGTVYMSLHDVSCGQALDWLSRSFNFNWMVDENSNAIIISNDTNMLQSKTFRIHYLNKDKVMEEMKALGIEETKIYANSETGTVSITGSAYQLQEAGRRLRLLDHPVAQCLVLAQLIEINHGKDLNLGFTYSLPTYSHAGTSSGYTNSDSFHGYWPEKLTFSATSYASKALSKGHVIARPMVMMLNGEKGYVTFGDRVPILKTTTTTASTQVTVDYEDVGTSLTITPSIDPETGEISMNMDIVVSTISQWITSGQTRSPQIAKRQATTSAHLRSGQSFVVGGLMNVKDLDNLTGIPGLMDLPILGKLFQYHQKSKSYSEVYIMITPYIVTNDIDPKDILRHAGMSGEGDVNGTSKK